MAFVYDAADTLSIFDFTCLYSPPDGALIEFRLGPYPQVCVWNAEGWSPAAGNAIEFNFRAAAPGSLNFNFNSGVCCPGGSEGSTGDDDTETEVVSTNGAVRSVGWKKLRRVDGSRKVGWKKLERVDTTLTTSFKPVENKLQKTLSVPWKSGVPTDKSEISVGCNAAKRVPEKDRSISWKSPPAKQREATLSWGALKPLDRDVVVPFVVKCRAVDIQKSFLWGASRSVDKQFAVAWINTLKAIDFSYRIVWGRAIYERICLRSYEPPAGDVISFDIDTALSHVGDKDHIDFWFERLSYDERCAQQEPSGWRDNYTNYTPASVPTVPMLGVYFRMNSASLIRVSDSAAVKVFTMRVKADIDSWCWQFTARIPAASLELVSPVSEPVEVLATINGYSWRIMIEAWEESKSFNRNEYTISGRSTSAELAAPYAPIISGVNDLATSVQIAEAQLTNTGWAIDFGDYESWLVGAGAFSYNNSSALKVVQRVAEASGGRLLTHRSDSSLLVIPRLHSLPWTWDSATPDLAISDYVVKQLGRRFLPGLSYNAVFVSGVNQGVLCKVTRSGSAGDQIAPMVTDALITDVAPARGRGQMIIGRSGKWSRETLELPLTAPEAVPGLLDMGMLVSMTEGSDEWRGQVSGIAIETWWDRDRGLQVKQDVDVERYRGD